MTNYNRIAKRKLVVRAPLFFLYKIYSALEYFPSGMISNQDLRDMPIYCIHLRRSKKRRKMLEKQVVKAGFLNFQFIEAIDGSLLDISKLVADGDYDDDLAIKYHNRSLSPAEIAISLSHGKVYDRIVKENHKIALIIEDDTIFLTKHINEIDISSFPSDWDVVFLYSTLNARPPKGQIKGKLHSIESWIGAAGAYLVSAEGASKLSKVYKPVIHASDGLLGRCMDYPEGCDHTFKQQGARTKINAYLIYPDCVLNGSVCGFYGSTH